MIELDSKPKQRFVQVLWTEHSYCNECGEPRPVTAFHVRPVQNVFRLCRECVGDILARTDKSLERFRAAKDKVVHHEQPDLDTTGREASRDEKPAFLRKIMD